MESVILKNTEHDHLFLPWFAWVVNFFIYLSLPFLSPFLFIWMNWQDNTVLIENCTLGVLFGKGEYPIYAWMGASCFVIIVMSEWRLPSFLRLEREKGTSITICGLGWNQSKTKESYMNCFTGINGKEGKSGRIFLLLKLWKKVWCYHIPIISRNS